MRTCVQYNNTTVPGPHFRRIICCVSSFAGLCRWRMRSSACMACCSSAGHLSPLSRQSGLGAPTLAGSQLTRCGSYLCSSCDSWRPLWCWRWEQHDLWPGLPAACVCICGGCFIVLLATLPHHRCDGRTQCNTCRHRGASLQWAGSSWHRCSTSLTTYASVGLR